uniref:F-box domain-containing protein n=1 Tax=Brassica oleracea TaxID=3712 RepID=A0A3P6A5Z6_BRAOL|nr:unnamed protein product [Brassica oleracea]
MMMSAGVEQLRRKKRRRVESPSSCGLMSLPYDMVLNSLARVSRSDLGALCLVSKSIRSRVSSAEMYETRSRMGLREECIYVCLGTTFGRKPPGWFILRRKGNRLIPIPMPSFPSPRRATYVSMGCGIYVIGGSIEAVSTSRVSFLDCRTHTWSQLPSMRFARCDAKAGVLDGKIYVTGGCDDAFSATIQRFSIQRRRLGAVCIPDPVMNNKVCKVVGPDNIISFKFWSEESLWNDFFLNARGDDDDCCGGAIIDRLLFSCDFDGVIKWCDPWSGVRKGSMEWYKVNGLEHLQGFLKFDRTNINTILFYGEGADVWNCHMLKRGYTDGLLGLIPGFKISKSAGNIVIFWACSWGQVAVLVC